MTKNDPPQNTPSRVGGRAPRSVGTGHTGNPCEYPGCTDKNASLSTLWERPDQDHDFGGTNREPRCREHWGLDAPRAPRPREPLPVDPGWKAWKVRDPACGKRMTGGLDIPPTVSELRRTLKQARSMLTSDPKRTLQICQEILQQKKRLRASGSQGIHQILGEFKALLRKAEEARSEARRAQRQSQGSVKSDSGSGPGGARENGASSGIEAMGEALREARKLLKDRPLEAEALCTRLLSRDPVLLGRRAQGGRDTFGDVFRDIRRQSQRKGRG